MAGASVVIPAYNAEATIGATLAALAGQDSDVSFEVIVVDDGSSDETVARIGQAPIDVTLLRSGQLGPGEARNRGVAASSGPIVAFTDADCVPHPAWLREGMSRIAAGADLVQGAVRPDSAATRLPFDRTVSVGRETGLYECASLFVRRDLFDELGGFEDLLGARLGKQLGEDTWFGWRARRHGARTEFAATALVEHAVFRRGMTGYLGERLRLVYFPALVRRIPELRSTLLWRRWFLTPRSAAFAGGLAGAMGALALGAWPLLAVAAPYLALLSRAALAWRLRAVVAGPAEMLADAIGFVALLAGSVRSRTLVL